MFFFTYNDSPSGIYKSQVIDVVNYLNALQDKEKVRLLALISLRGFFTNRKKIKASLPDSIVIPMFPKAQFWKMNYLTLFFIFLFSSHKKIMARGPFACKLSLKLRHNGLIKKVIFDARGAYYAELNEYDVVKSESIKRDIAVLEKQVVLESDYRLAVSNALVGYWKKEFGYSANSHVVVPCTLGRDFIFDFPSEKEIRNLKNENGFGSEDIIFIYSGSAAGWQSFKLVDTFMSNLMDKDPRVKLVILSSHFDRSAEVVKRFPERVKITWLNQQEVKKYLLMSDYGILLREQTVTNQVASPVKFAEYLSCGLKVVISDDLGDYTDFTKNQNVGFTEIQPVKYSEKQEINKISLAYFTKDKYKNAYLELLNL